MKIKDLKENIKKTEEEIKELRLEDEKLRKKIQRKVKALEKLKIEFNKDNFKSMEWLIQNPTEPGQYEALREMFNNLYGGEYNGIHPSGYIHDGEYKQIQQNFNIIYGEYDYHDHVQDRKNIEHFMENYLGFLKPVMEVESLWDDKYPAVNVVPFQFSSKSSGLDYIGYEPEGKKWYHFTMVYSRVDVKRDFDSLEEALDFVRDFEYGDD